MYTSRQLAHLEPVKDDELEPAHRLRVRQGRGNGVGGLLAAGRPRRSS